MTENGGELLSEFSLAVWISNLLSTEVKEKNTKLLEQFKDLHSQKLGNDTNKLIDILKMAMTDLEQISKDHTTPKETYDFLSKMMQDLDTLKKNCEDFKIEIHSAHDAYALNKTTLLIQLLIKMNQEGVPEKKLALEDKKLSELVTKSSSVFKSSPEKTGVSLSRAIRESLQKECENVRKLIGSKESNPRGLIIMLTMHLSQAIQDIGADLVPEDTLGKELLTTLELERDNIRKYFPDLAEAGQKLQEAFSNVGIQAG